MPLAFFHWSSGVGGSEENAREAAWNYAGATHLLFLTLCFST